MILFDTEKYEVRFSEDELVIGEDGAYSARSGYIVVNKDNGVVEHTTMMLPGAIFQCTHFNDTLISLLAPPVEAPEIDLEAIDVPEDVIAN